MYCYFYVQIYCDLLINKKQVLSNLLLSLGQCQGSFGQGQDQDPGKGQLSQETWTRMQNNNDSSK